MEEKLGVSRLRVQIEARLDAIRSRHRWRSLRPTRLDPAVIDLTHNDYLGLRTDPAYQARARAAAAAWPVGSGASRLLGGELPVYAATEQSFAAWVGAESALYFSSGYAANEAVMLALQLEGAVYFSDALNHASLIDGMRSARLAPAQKAIFAHNDIRDLERQLASASAPLRLVVTEALFSMDGDFCPILEIAELCKRYGALLVLDEAHSIGVYGARGSGVGAALPRDSYLAIYPCGKAMAASGAFVAGPTWFRDYLINTSRAFIYSTGVSPWVAAALGEAIVTIQELDDRRLWLEESAAEMRDFLRHEGYDIGTSRSHIIPLIVGSEQRALAAESFLRQQGIETRAIRPPTVPENACRLRLSLHAGLDSQDLAYLKAALKELRYDIP